MKRTCLGLFSLGVIFPLLAGCGSSSTPVFSLSCTTHRGPAGKIRADVTVTNTTSTVANAILFGPGFRYLTHFAPVVLAPARVTVKQSGGQTPYVAFILPGVRPNKPSHLVLRFEPPPVAEPVAVTSTRVIQASDPNPLSTPNCVIP